MRKLFKSKKSFIFFLCVKIIVFIAVVIGIFFLIQKDENPVKIGAIIPLTGSASQHAVFVEAMELAIDEINAFGGINGRKIELIVADSKTIPKIGVDAFRTIEKENHPLLYVSTTSVVSIALAPFAKKNKVVLVGLAVANPVLTKDKDWVFKYYVSPEHEVKPILQILEQLNVKDLHILYQNDHFGFPLYEIFKESFENKDHHVTGVSFVSESPEFEEKIPALLDSEAIYIAGYVNNVGQAIKQIRGAGYRGYILSHSGATSLLQSLPEINDVYVASPIIYNPNFIFARDVKEKYEKKYGNFFTHQAANGYDFIKLLAGLCEGQDLTRENVRKLLDDEFSFPGIFGYIEKKQGEHDIFFPLYPARIDKGEVHYLQ